MSGLVVSVGRRVMPPARPTPSAPPAITQTITGDHTILNQSGTTISGLRVTGQLLIRGCTNLTVTDSWLGALAISGGTGITLSRFLIDGKLGTDAMHITSDTGRVSDVILQDGWVHNPILSGASHYDGLQVRGVSGLTVRDVMFDQGPGGLDAQLNASIYLETANGGNEDVLIERVESIVRGYFHLYLYGDRITIRDSVFHNFPQAQLVFPSSTATIAQSGNTDNAGVPLTINW